MSGCDGEDGVEIEETMVLNLDGLATVVGVFIPASWLHDLVEPLHLREVDAFLAKATSVG